MQIPPINPNVISGYQGLGDAQKPAASSSTAQAAKSFDQILSSLNQSQVETDDLVQKLSMGENVDLHQVMIGLEENDVNFRVALAIRDKLVEAYHEVMRMQI